jgi:ankyrin repeat protein
MKKFTSPLFFLLAVCTGSALHTHNLFCMEESKADQPTPIIINAAYENNIAMVREALTSAPEQLHYRDPRTGQTVLIIALRNEYYDMVKLLLDTQHITFLLQDKDIFGHTALMYATICEHSTMLQLLIDAHVKNKIGLNDQDHTMGWTALMRAAFFGKTEFVQLLLNAHADPCMRNNHGDTALTLAAQRQYPDVVNILINTAPESAKCSICFEHGGNFRQLPCGHYFHSACIRKWFERAPTCPLCREQEKADKPPASHTFFRLGNAD